MTYLTKSEEINTLILEKDYIKRLFKEFEEYNEENKKYLLIIRCFGNIAILNNNLITLNESYYENMLNIFENIIADHVKYVNKIHKSNLIIGETLWSLANLLNNNEVVASFLLNKTNIYRLLINIMPLIKTPKVLRLIYKGNF